MRKVSTTLFVVGLAAAALCSASQTQGQAKARPSPAAKAECKFADGKSITVDYSSPRMKSRTIYGGLVPFGQVWRTGANEATSFVTSGDLTIDGKVVGAGKYTLFTVPNATGWTLIVSKKTGMWGTDYPGDAEDLLRAPMKVSKVASPVENFTISFTPAGGGCTMHLDWESTRASVEIAQKK